MKTTVWSRRNAFTTVLVLLVSASLPASAQDWNFPGQNNSWPSGGSSNYNSCYNLNSGTFGRIPGSNDDRDRDGRPTMNMACGMEPEYDCPLFENRPHDALNQALDTMFAAISTTPECARDSSSLSLVSGNTNAIRTALITLQQYMKNPEMLRDPDGGTATSADIINTQIQQAILAANGLGQLFNNNTLLRSQCGRDLMSNGNFLIALNDIVTNLAPYALMASSVTPGLGPAASFAITGGVAATTAVSSFVRLIDQNTLNMNNPEHRKAVLKNTCQFWKIDRKVTYMKLAQSGRIQDIAKDLENQEAYYSSRFNEPSEDLQKLIEERNRLESAAVNITKQVSRDNFDLGSREMQLTEAASDPYYTCAIGLDLLAQLSRATPEVNSNTNWAFPATVFYNLGIATSLIKPPAATNLPNDGFQTDQPPAVVKDPRVSSLLSLDSISRRRLTSLAPKVNDNTADDNTVQQCANTTKTWVNGLRQALKLTLTLVNEARARFDGDQSQNPDYVEWNNQTEQLQQTRRMKSRVIKVMEELRKDNSVIDRSELDQRHHLLKTALLGQKDGWNSLVSRAPVHAWLEHTLQLYGNRISSFRENIRSLETLSQRLTPRAAEVKVLANMTLENIPFDSAGHKVACKLLKTSWFDFSGAIDHLGASEFMCDMIDDLIDNKVDRSIANICTGEIDFQGKPITPSRISILKAGLNGDRVTTRLSDREWAKTVADKLTALQCPTAPVSVMK